MCDIRHVITSILLITLMAGCDTTSSIESDVLIRIQNNSSYTLNDLKVVFPEDEVAYGDVSGGKKSGYEQVIKAYRYAYIETVVREKKLVLQPIDYVGESLLDHGRYTYELSIHEETYNSENYRYSLSLQLTED
ncbi:hypothetical protein NC796_21215 [Aliifodinibius sp. S!AR15-10]|uniref:hypothetical protein n=1 Tax=Aliifodinibius sp. S!AR15-10 TaxID=2950437 RepID=UPI0028569DF1|nr:hypothetical protein [Aliifodinibius sp. S!AR15-10]MDR8393688.1 hypothetical protein [Aliifodinibius sp. S!AR15-10]